jgi:transposase-like protein
MNQVQDKRAQWRERIREWELSGKTAEEFARHCGVNVSTVYWWRKQLQQQVPALRSNTAMAFVKVPLQTPVRAAERCETIEIVLRGDRRVRVTENFSERALQAVVRALEAM